MNYLDSLRQQTNTAYTENGAPTNASTLDANLDFFSRAGAMRNDISGVKKLFNLAYAEDPQLAIRNLFYIRDIRGGQGERKIFRECLKEISETDMAKVVSLIPEYGRWDDLFYTGVDVSEIIKAQLEEDEKNMREGNSVSLLAKWLPSENSSSQKTASLAREIISGLNISEKIYRKRIVALRKYLNILERLMSSNRWEDINYEKLPSQALRKHVGAFKRHDVTRYEEYLKAVNSGEKKINTSTLYTYEVYDMVNSGQEDTANAMWNNLPDFTNGKNALVVADVSGSMGGRPMSVSVSLALYFAERNNGPFKDYFMTFSENPKMQKVVGKTLRQKMRNLQNADWGMNTDIEKVFQAVLSAAVESGAKQDEIPSVIYIISDMQFDSCISRANKTAFLVAKDSFEQAGYTLPHIVFWNVRAGNNSPATKFDNRVTLISGSSQSTFRYAVEGKSPMELMNDVLSSERYSKIKL